MKIPSYLLARKMTRKEFLLFIGSLLLVVSGVTGILKFVSDPYSFTKQASKGFGKGPYGA